MKNNFLAISKLKTAVLLLLTSTSIFLVSGNREYLGLPSAHAAVYKQGPHVDNLVIDISTGQGIAFLKLKSGAVDMIDQPLNAAQIADVLGADGSPPDPDIGLLDQPLIGCAFPVCAYAIRKPFWVGPGPIPTVLRGIINADGIGFANFWSLFNAYRCLDPLVAGCADSPYGGTFRLGVSSILSRLNPVTSSLPEERFLLSLLYDTILARDPYNYDAFRRWIGECTVPTFSVDCLSTAAWAGATPHGIAGGGAVVSVNLSPGLDGLLGTDDDIRFRPHGDLCLPGPDAAVGAGCPPLPGDGDDILSPSTMLLCSAGGSCGKPLDGHDIEASLLYVRDHGGFLFAQVADVVDMVVGDRPDVPGVDSLHVDVYFAGVPADPEEMIATMPILPSDIWSIKGAGADLTVGTGDDVEDDPITLVPGGIPANDPIPDPAVVNALDPNGDDSIVDHWLYGTGPFILPALALSPSDVLTIGVVLDANRNYIDARTPVNFDVTGDLDVFVGVEKITGVTAPDVADAVAQFQFGLPYNVQRDINFDRRTDLDDYLAVLAYFQDGSVALTDGTAYGGTLDTVFRAWPSQGP